MYTKSSHSKWNILLVCISAIVIRYLLMTSKYQKVISNHVEVSTPLNSWKRVLEGQYLISKNIDPYSGDLLHEIPLALYFYNKAIEIFQSLNIMFIGFDIVTGLLLFATAKKYMHYQRKYEENRKKTYAKDVKEYLLSDEDCSKAPMHVLMAYLFNPFSLLVCVGYSTIVIHNFYLGLFLCSLTYGNVVISGMALAICGSMSFYPVILIIPQYVYYSSVFKSKTLGVLSVLITVAGIVVSTYISGYLANGFHFLTNVYGCILTVPDLQPNIGLFWYFFTEMFDHFRELFIYSFQINATILYLFPLAIKFRKQPFLLTVALLFLISIFKSYPCVGDVGFVLSLLPCFTYLFAYCQQGFLVGVIFLITTSLAPILWYLWIYCNSANANFYFGVTLAFAIAQIFLVTDILFAQIKREFTLVNGKERKINGEEAILSLE